MDVTKPNGKSGLVAQRMRPWRQSRAGRRDEPAPPDTFTPRAGEAGQGGPSGCPAADAAQTAAALAGIAAAAAAGRQNFPNFR